MSRDETHHPQKGKITLGGHDTNALPTGDNKISAIIPYYNGSKYIDQTLQSVFYQTLQPCEIIVVNDGSDEDSTSFIKQLSERYPITLLHKENGGQSSARNFGVQRSEGNLIAFLDQDDIWYPNHLEELVKPLLEKAFPELGWVYSSYDLIGANGELIYLHLLFDHSDQHPKRSLVQCLGNHMHISLSASIITKKAFNDVGGFDEKLTGWEDEDLFLRLFYKGYGHIYLNKSLYQWRWHNQNTIWTDKMANGLMIFIRKIINNFPYDPITNTNFPIDIIVPRFQHLLMGEYNRSLLINDKSLANIFKKNLTELFPYMYLRLKIKTKLLLILSKHYYLNKLLKPLINYL